MTRVAGSTSRRRDNHSSPRATLKVDFRLEGYLFKPFEYIRPDEDQEAYSNDNIKSVFFCGTAGVVYHSPIGPVSLSMNYYDDDRNQLGALLHIGFLLFNKHSLE